MPRRRSSCVLLLILLLSPMLCIAAEPSIAGVQIESASDAHNVWLTKTLVAPDEKESLTVVYEREEGQQLWHTAGTITGHVSQLTHYGNQLVALLPDGQWLFVGQSTGRSLPGRAGIVALAGDATDLWALGDPSVAPTTAPTTQTSTTQPATRPATTTFVGPRELWLYRLVQGRWEQQKPLPQPARPDRVALGVMATRPVVAISDGEVVSVMQLDASGNWINLGEQPATGLSPREVLTDDGHLFVYLTGEGGFDHLLVRSDHWRDPLSLEHSSQIRSLGLAGGMLRYAYVDGQKLRQRSINTRTLQVDGEDQEILLPEPTTLQRLWEQLFWIMVGVVGLVVLHTYRQREDYRQLSPDWNKVQLAPFGRRIFAGLVDLMPVLTTALYAKANIAHVDGIRELLAVPQSFNLLAWSVVIYLAHTTIIEAIGGRSLGKIVARLHVVRLDGGRPNAAALVLRNLLRCVDVVLMFTPILMLYLPLRQRIGDMAATTVVVADRDEDLVGPDA